MLHADVEIEAPSPDGGESIRYAIATEYLRPPHNLIISFPRPLRQWFENIVDTGASITLLRSEDENTGGEIVTLETAWRMAEAFFGDFMDPAFRGRHA